MCGRSTSAPSDSSAPTSARWSVRHSLQRPAGRQLEHEQPQLRARLLVGGGEARAVGGEHDLVVEGLVRLGHGAPGRPRAAAHRGQPVSGPVNAPGQACHRGARAPSARPRPPARFAAPRARARPRARGSSRALPGSARSGRSPLPAACAAPSASEWRATSYSRLSASSRRGVPGARSPSRIRRRSAWVSASTVVSARALNGYSIRPWRMPIATACVRVDASSFARIRFVWVRTVSVERPSFSATASVCMPSASI